jgi:1,2-diacylglycerol 3-alpha-glucosyltransferase
LLIAVFFEAAKVAKEVKLDIVHTQTEFSMGTIGKYVAHQLKIPAIHTYHTMYEDYLHYVLNGHLLKPVHVKAFTHAYLHSMNGVIAPSMRVKKLLERYDVEIPVRVIPTGVDFSELNADRHDDVRKKLGLKDSDYILLTLSRIASEKKISRILDAMPAIIEQYPNVKLVIAGDGPDKQELEDQIARLTLEDYVLFTGAIDHEDVGNYYRMADLFVSASDTETQGLTYIEALSEGTRCVVYKTDYTEQVFDNDELGKAFTSKEEMLADILEYMKQGRSSIPANILNAKRKELSAERFGQQVADFYEDVITGAAGENNEGNND